jgi:predicted ABC-type ATPase
MPSILDIRVFVNADEIARGLSPLDPKGSEIMAGRLMLDRLDELASAGENFAFETTCAGRGHIRLLQTCRAAGYRIMLVFLWLPSPDIALARVARRVSQGGHQVPDDVVIRRYSAGLRNMRQLYLPLADTALIYDNSDGDGLVIAEQLYGKPLSVYDEVRWKQIEEVAK